MIRTLLALVSLAGVAAASPTVITGDPLPTGPGDCAGCHKDAAAQWSASAHRFSSFNNPYYRVSVEDFRKERGKPASKFCAGCHEPVLLQAGMVDKDFRVTSPEAQAGLTCLVCHSIDAIPDLDGNGGFHLTNSAVPVGKPVHGARLRPPLLGDPKLCGSCHKVGLEPEITHDRFIRGQDDYDPWQAASASGNGAGAVWRAAEAKRCQDCHMPLEPAVLGDPGAKNGMIRSHRFLGANSALPSLRADADHLERTRAFLAGAVTLDAWITPGKNHAIVVMRNRRVGHRFPGGTMDSNEVWLELEARDAAGRVLGRSGGRGPDGTLEADAHLVRAQPVDKNARALLRRDPQHMYGVAWDASLSPADPQAVKFALPPGTTEVTARLNYRKFTAPYARRACRVYPAGELRKRCEELPIIEMSTAVAKQDDPEPDDWQRLLDRGLALAAALADCASDALPFLERAQKLQPGRPEPLLGLARLAMQLGQTDAALESAGRAAALAPNHPAAQYLQATALERAYRHAAARAPAERLLALLPTDRTALALVARVRGVLGDAKGALEAADQLIAVDPGLDEAHYQRALALAELGRSTDAALAQSRYLYYRVATEIDLALRVKWRQLNPGRPDESVPAHTHALHAAR